MSVGTARAEPDAFWLWDTGASRHVSKDLSLMINIRAELGSVRQAFGPTIRYQQIGDVWMDLKTEGSSHRVLMERVVYHPEANFNLFSPKSALARANRGHYVDNNNNYVVYPAG